MNKSIVLFLMFFLSLSFVSSASGVFLDSVPEHNMNSPLSFSIPSDDAISCELVDMVTSSGVYPLGLNGSKSSQSFTFTLTGSNFTTSGLHTFTIVCYDGSSYVTGSEYRYVKSDPYLFYVDFSDSFNIVLFVLSLIVAVALYFFKFSRFTSLILLFDGFILLMSGVNFIWSLSCIVSSIIIAFASK